MCASDDLNKPSAKECTDARSNNATFYSFTFPH